MSKNLFIATEDAVSEAVVDRLVELSPNDWTITVRMGRYGNGYLRNKLDGLLRTAVKVPVFLLTDLDQGTCAPDLIRAWLGGKTMPRGMFFRVAVREIEVWLLADREGISNFLGIPLDKLPDDPESLPDPKQTLLNLVKRYGSRSMKSELLQHAKTKTSRGLGYNAELTRFVRDEWDPSRAASRSDSLARAMRCL